MDSLTRGNYQWVQPSNKDLRDAIAVGSDRHDGQQRFELQLESHPWNVLGAFDGQGP